MKNNLQYTVGFKGKAKESDYKNLIENIYRQAVLIRFDFDNPDPKKRMPWVGYHRIATLCNDLKMVIDAFNLDKETNNKQQTNNQ